ncbi:MAG TPA: HAD family phosphatase [archaeon]|nr:HAD family phosphatase [archaeon]
MIKAIISDYGGVFGEEVMNMVYSETAKRTGASLDAVKSEYRNLVPLISRGKITMQEFWKSYAQRLKSDPILIEVIWTRTFEINSKINKDVEKILKKLKNLGYKIAVCTNTIKAFSDVHSRNKDYGFFDAVIASCDVGMMKPDREMYELVLKKLGVAAEECVFIDDNSNNVEGAEKVGMKAILFKDAKQLEDDLRKCGVHGI